MAPNYKYNNHCNILQNNQFRLGANYRAACRAKSTPDFINKLKIVAEERDETLFWLEVLEESNILKGTEALQKELNKYYLS